MKKLAIIFILALVFVFIAPPAQAAQQEQQEPSQQSSLSIINMMVEMKMQNKILELTEHVGKTRYAFGGSTPKGWDCSGLVLWFYSDFNVNLTHSATVQISEGQIVDTPQPGDIVSLVYPGSKRVYHNGIYFGDGKMIHSPRPGRVTELRLISEMHVNHIVVYTRIIQSGKID
jgi:cell wall-associated NlpC family hydrolase